MTRHVSTDAVARFHEGDLSPRKAARVQAHLADCPRCSETSDNLARVTTMLASTTVPPIPDHLATRIQSALATEAAQRIVLERDTEPGRRDLRGSRGRPRRRLPRMASPTVLRVLAAAGAVALIAGGGYGISRLAGSSSSASTGAGAAIANGRAGGPAGGVRFGPAMPYRHTGNGDTFTPVATGTNFQPASLTARVRDEIAQVRGAASSAGGRALARGTAGSTYTAGPRAPGAFGSEQMTALAACVARIAAGRDVKLVDVARYSGAPATVIVIAPAGSVSEQIVVVGPDCSASDSDILARRALQAG